MKQHSTNKANIGIVVELQQRLLKTFEEYANELVDKDIKGEGLKYIDALMGCHNFYKAIILDLEERSQSGGLIKRIALDTLKQALKLD